MAPSATIENRLVPYPSMKNKMEEVFYTAPELFNHITRILMSLLPVSDIRNFIQTCKGIAHVGTSRLMWQILFHRDFCPPNEDIAMDYYEMYKQLYDTQFTRGIGVRLTCSRESIGMGTRAVFTTTIYNNTDYPLLANHKDAPSSRYESAAQFVSAWKSDKQLMLMQATPSFQQSARMIGMSSQEGLAVRVLPPRSTTELSVVGRLSDSLECINSSPDGVYLSFPSHHLKVAEQSTNEFWVRTRVQFEATEVLSNLVKLRICRPKPQQIEAGVTVK